ncbi:DUF6600 domain-containing protein [Usitatibacter palustris]|uniref:FecR family protein n=1 Tax=Usitatibacter palustris TaxID=2732487 RepID=A0A6M4H885_9PROT|nr:DUF6600 domain-containing protein [Usitatibacter palustris]QJR15800.1 hypothetical protein DSM104440_02626 [Usitatibacter palustris]
MRHFTSLLFALALPWVALAQVAEPPGRVGRVSWTQGEVALFNDPERDWEKAYINSPLTSENSLWTEAAARAEVRIGSTALRLEEYTQLDIRRLDDEQLVAHVVRGALAVRIRHFEQGERYVVSTPFARFHLLGNGRYRIDTDEVTEASRLTVFAGTAQLETSGRRIGVREGEAVFVQSDSGQFDFQRAEPSPFDDWSLGRDERVQDRETSQYVSPRMTGYEDLERFGAWSQEPDYGAVWYPSNVGVDYVPYRNGNWVYARPWGWTWVDQAPWGYAPFHYGRWAYINHRWGWCPGGYVARPVWAPALVGWVGTPGWSVSVGSAHAPVVGWYPLSPRDRYRPWYNSNPRYIDRVNNHGRPNDRERPGWRPREDDRTTRDRGTTIVLREGFVNQRPVSSSQVAVSGEIAAAQPVTSGATVLPSRREAMVRKPLHVGPAPTAAPGPVGGEAAVRPEGSRAARSPVPRSPTPPASTSITEVPAALSPTRPTTNAPNYRAPVAGTPSSPEPQARPQTKPLRAAPTPPQPGSAWPAPVQGAPAATPAPSARSRQVPQQQQPAAIQERPAPAPAPAQAPQVIEKPVARSSTPRPAPVEKPDAPDKPDKPDKPDTPAPVPVQKPMRVQQR